MHIEESLARYLDQPGFSRMTAGWKEKYQRLGHLGGTLVLKELTAEEQRCLGPFLGMDLSSGELKITYAKFSKLLANTKFEGADFVKVLHLLNGDKIYTKQELLEIKADKEQKFKQRINQKYGMSAAGIWLKNFFSHDSAYLRYLHEDELFYEQLLCHVAEALNELPCQRNEEELLAVFSERMTHNPHYFDHGLTLDLLVKGISCLLDLEGNQNPADVLNAAGIIKDELSNYCPICHIEPLGYYPAWNEFSNHYEPWNMNLMNIRKIHCHFTVRPIYIVENPAVFSCLCDTIKQHELDIGLICGNGQINRCTYTLLDKLEQSGCSLYYAGDFDPEGLLIADKLKRRYPRMKLWCMEIPYFRKIAVKYHLLSERRIRILDQIQSPELNLLADLIREEKILGYQEGLIEDYQKNLLTLTEAKRVCSI